jgi:hypothetical protein
VVRYLESRINLVKKPRETIISLTGGLGNQLFQLAVGLHIAQGEKLSLEWSVGKPRLNKSGLPEIASFELPTNVCLERIRKRNWLVEKSTGYMLRMGFEPKNFEKFTWYFVLARSAASVIISIYFKRFCTINPARKHGYHIFNHSAKGNFIVGYFQSCKWSEQNEVSKSLRTLRISGEHSKLSEIKSLAICERPLIVHIRLSDYRNEDNFGILPRTYYEASISRMWKSGEYKKIWAFSDEPEFAKDFLSFIPAENLRWIEAIEDSASLTLEAMRNGCGYVIGNSTYSWWGAFLSYEPNAKVIAPSPWFRKIPSPQDLTPSHWDTEVSW